MGKCLLHVGGKLHGAGWSACSICSTSRSAWCDGAVSESATAHPRTQPRLGEKDRRCSSSCVDINIVMEFATNLNKIFPFELYGQRQEISIRNPTFAISSSTNLCAHILKCYFPQSYIILKNHTNRMSMGK